MANVLGRGVIKIGDEGKYKAVKKLYVKNGPEWKDAKTAWVKQNGEWIQVYPTPVANITFDPPTLNFEAPNGYESPTQFVNITNNGTENLIIEDFSTSYTVSGKFVTFFDLSELGGQIPVTIAPGETKRLGIAIDAGSGAAYVQQEVVTIVDTPTLKTVQVLCPLLTIDVDYLVVAGGGGGGAGIGQAVLYSFYGVGSTYNGNGAGGGGGGAAIGYKKPIKRGETVQIKVGRGGAGASYRTGLRSAGENGGNSSFGDIVAIGGGGGGGQIGGWINGQPGGSGGGGAYGGGGGGGTSGQGFPGAPSTTFRVRYGLSIFGAYSPSGALAGGGGGSGGTGSGTTGGPGRASTITGTRQYYGGGGGAGSGIGGIGGGGGGNTAGTANTGGGGGGMAGNNFVRYRGADGGSGIVIIKYDYDIQLGDGGTVTTYTTEDGVKHWVHTFTQDGTFTYKEVLETKTITVLEPTATITRQLGLSNTGELGSSESTIRMKTNVGAFGTQYSNYTIFGEVTAPYAEADVVLGLDYNLEYFRYNPRQTRLDCKIGNNGSTSLIITSIEGVGPYFKIVSYPDAIAPKQYGIVVIESRIDDLVEPNIYKDVITIKSNNVNGDIRLNLTLDVMFPAGNARISTAGLGTFTVPEGVYRLSEVRVIGGGGGGGQGFNQQDVPKIPNPNATVVVDYLVVGGGGSGAGTIRTGGGGGGAVLEGSIAVAQDELISVVIGQGGASIPAGTVSSGNSGTASSFKSISAPGGGGGGLGQGNPGVIGGGGGGGAGGATGSPGTFAAGGQGGAGKTIGSVTFGSGGNGVQSSTSTGGWCAGGGGGGAGGNGANAVSTGGQFANQFGGAGGIGLASTITGTTRLYGGGGGGAGINSNGTESVAQGGQGGGGAGGVPGTANTGGGGGSATGGTASGRGGSGVVIVRYESSKQICTGGTITSYSIDGKTYWVHTFTSTGTFTYVGVDPVLFGGIGALTKAIVPGSGAGGGGGSGSIVSVANVEVIPGDVIEYIVGAGGAGVDPILSTTNPAPSGKPGQPTSFNKGLVAAGGGLGGGGGGPNTGGVGAGNTPNPKISGASLVPRTLSWAWSGHMNTYAVWDNYSDASNSWYTFRIFTPTVSDTYRFYLSCDNYGVVYLNGPAILSTTSFQSVSGVSIYLQKDTVNTIGMYAQNWGGPCGYALNIVNSAGQTVWDTRSKMAAESVEAHPAAVSRKGGVGQNGTAGIGDGGYGGSNTFGLGGAPGLYVAPPPAGSVYFANQAAFTSSNNPNLILAGDFTIECWIKQTGRPNGYNAIFELGQWPNTSILVRSYGGSPDFWVGSSYPVGNIYPFININQWHHVAVSRQGTTIRVFVDGVVRLSVSIGGTLNPAGLPITIGSDQHALGGQGFTGYISNFRFVNGTALYTGTFTPPRQLLTAVPGTVVLACQTGDSQLNSTGLVTLSKYGTPANSDEVPFLIPNKPITLSAGGRGRGPGTGGGGGASGVDGQFTPASGPGADGEVYIAWGPIIPRDPPQNLIAHFVVSIDEQRMYDRILPYCNPYVMQTSGFFTEKGRDYVLFNGSSGNYIGTPADPKYDLVKVANTSFTIEAWVILKGAGQYPYWGGEIINRDAEYEVAITQNDQVTVAIDWGVGSDVNLPGGGWIVPPAGRAIVPRNIPTHIAVVADQSTLYIYINGTLSYTTPLNRVARRDNTPVWIGNRPGQSQGFNGGIADLRIWNVARTQAQIQANMQGLIYNTPQGI